MHRGGLRGLWALLVLSSPGLAQDMQLFRPAVDSKGYFTQNASQILGHLEPSFGLLLNYGRRPLEVVGPMAETIAVHTLLTVHVQAALGLFGFGEAGVGVPLTIWSGESDPPGPGPQEGIDGQGVGDLSLFAKGRILSASRNPVGLAVVLGATAPTGDETKYLGEGIWTVWPTLVVDTEIANDTLHLAINAGARLRSEDRAFSQVQPTFGLGVAYVVAPQLLDVVVEMFGSHSSRENSPWKLTPLEAIGGLKFYLARNSYLAFGGGAGATESFGSPDIRAFGSFIFEPAIGDRDGDSYKDDVDQCPLDPEDFDDFEDRDGCPEPDNDRDGILDVDDTCPNEPEDKDGQQDSDGCWEPDELDRDGDAIKDEADKCPDEPEDKDAFEDKEGCPDPDNDRDTILDVDDSCPIDPEDLDKFEDEEGCPDPDNDRDRIVDVKDKCPNEPEIYNGFEDEDGCPDRGRVVVRKGRIEILDKIYFETNKAVIKPISYPLLDAIAATLKGNPQILLVEIQGHADERAPDQYNMELTQARAQSVQDYLVEKGVKQDRLQAKGYGETQPVCPEHNEDCWSKNRRVEFVILKRAEEAE